MGDLQTLMRDVDLMFSLMNGRNGSYHFTPISDCDFRYPVIDQRYTDTEQQIIIAATGASKEDFEVQLKDDILTVKRTNSTELTDKYKYVKKNISRKKFDIAFKIPKMWDAENLDIKLDKGELIITLPIKEQAKPKVKEFYIK